MDRKLLLRIGIIHNVYIYILFDLLSKKLLKRSISFGLG